MQKEIYLAVGCFWGVEKYFSLIDGVLETQVGYANGNTDTPPIIRSVTKIQAMPKPLKSYMRIPERSYRFCSPCTIR